MPRNPKTRALGSALRQAREDKGLVLREFATLIDQNSGVLSRWETGDRTPKPEYVAKLLTALDVKGRRYDEIMTLAYRTDEARWVAANRAEQRQQIVAYIEWEQTATRIVEVSPLLIPGLLQTSDYIETIMRAEGVSADEIAARTATRIGRREVIAKHGQTELVVLIGEGALRQNIGGPAVMLKQLHHLLKIVAQPNIEMRIFPNDRSYHPGLDGVFTIIESGRATTGSIVFVDARQAPLMLHEAEDVCAYQDAADRVARECLSPQDSIRLIMAIARELEGKVDAGKQLAQIQPQPQLPDLRRGAQHP